MILFVIMFLSVIFVDNQDMFSNTAGTVLCQELIKSFDSISHRSLEQHYVVKMAIANSLKSLLVMSTTAKTAALEGK